MRKFIVRLNGNEYNVEVDEVGTAALTGVPVQPAPVAVQSVAPAAKTEPKKEVAAVAAKPAVKAEGVKLESPLPGVVLKLVVGDGATVKNNDVVLIIEAMKLENEIRSNADGVIHFAVSSGATVESGQVLAYIK
ncbi:MAG: acetyl-CoA carboxylase biotin carboxyl carrier protein subunit [Clostridia bacterium]|nr:acetyl-CoA carboxylase biotin carboxyl carrier protein subunit [Clostridia bacterium]